MKRNHLRLILSLLVYCAFLFLTPSAMPRDRGETLAIVGAKAYPAPTAPPISDSVVLVVGGKIEAIGARSKIRLAKNAKVLDATGLTLVAGFWNCHVHFTEPQWQDAANQPADKLASQIQGMLTRYGFTTVYDIGSVLGNTSALRKRIEAGEVMGPRIFTTGQPLFPKNGVPIYVKTVISPELFENLKRVAEVESSEQAQAMVGLRIEEGADAIKVFTGSWIGGDKTVEMPLDVVKAATVEAHRLGKLVFAHPQTRGGVDNAIAGAVDILAHTAPTGGAWDAALLARMNLAKIALIPTLKLWHVEALREHTSPEDTESWINAGVEQLRAFTNTGGRILFGTDVGYIDDYDTTEEFALMSRAGMSFQEILTSLTTAPAARFSHAELGRIVPGFSADLVLLQGYPATDVKAFANVKYTIRGGKIIYQRP